MVSMPDGFVILAVVLARRMSTYVSREVVRSGDDHRAMVSVTDKIVIPPDDRSEIVARPDDLRAGTIVLPPPRRRLLKRRGAAGA